jgi:hypothetical protein
MEKDAAVIKFRKAYRFGTFLGIVYEKMYKNFGE